MGPAIKTDSETVLLTADEVAALLRTSRKAIYAMAERGLLPGVIRIGRRLLVRRRPVRLAAAQVRAIAGKVAAMSVTVRPYRRGGWEVDITFRLPNGSRHRERSKAPVSSKSAAQRWGEDRERHLLQHGLPQSKKEVPTLTDFKDRFLDGYARANRQKPSGIAAKESILKVHLVPELGTRKLDAITNETVQRIKHGLKRRSAKTVNNVLTVLNTLLKQAVAWEVIERMPCTIRLLPITKSSATFHDFDDYERLVETARDDPQAYLIVLLGGEAGLRCGEMMATGRRSRNERCRGSSHVPLVEPISVTEEFTFSGTRSAHIWRCAARRLERFKSWLATRRS